MNKITEITRNEIIDILTHDFVYYYGRKDEIAFLKRLYNLNEIPSNDGRFKDAEGDIYQHTINNDDWDRDWVFSDSRFELMTSDEKLLRFICEVFHPAVRNETQSWREYKEQINLLLKEDGYEIYEQEKISGRPVYNWKNISSIMKTEKSQPLKLHPIGQGSYANVFSYTDDFYNKKFALKRAKENISSKDLDRFKREFETMKSLNSPYIVEVYNFDSSKNEYIMEYMDIDLYKFIDKNKSRLTNTEKFFIINQILRCFQYLEEKQILHRDISYKNILLKNYEHLPVVKISDFGLVKLKESTLTDPNTEFRGSLNDPKLEREGFEKYGKTHETYALTKLIVFILTGKTNTSRIKEKNILEFLDRGTHDDQNKRYKNVNELMEAISILREHLS